MDNEGLKTRNKAKKEKFPDIIGVLYLIVSEYCAIVVHNPVHIFN